MGAELGLIQVGSTHVGVELELCLHVDAPPLVEMTRELVEDGPRPSPAVLRGGVLVAVALVIRVVRVKVTVLVSGLIGEPKLVHADQLLALKVVQVLRLLRLRLLVAVGARVGVVELVWLGRLAYQELLLLGEALLLLLLVVPFLARDVLVGAEEQNHLVLLVLDGHNIEQAPEGGPFSSPSEGGAQRASKRHKYSD